MTNTPPPKRSFTGSLKKLIGRLIYSRFGSILANLPPISWITRKISYHLAGKAIKKSPQRGKQAPFVDLTSSLQRIAHDIVETLGYAGAMVAIYEQGDALPVRAFYVDPEMIAMDAVRELEEEVSTRFGEMLSPEFCPDGRISLTDPSIARVYVHKEAYRRNLSARAAQKKEPVLSDYLFDLFTPIAPDSSRSFIEGIQARLGIQQVVAVPFFIETRINDKVEEEYVGNLFAAKQSTISEGDLRILSSFARQAAAAILGERRRLQAEVMQELILDVQRGLIDEEKILQRIVEGIVSELKYPGAMVATYEEASDALPVRGIYIDPQIIEMHEIHQLEDKISSDFSEFLSPKFCPDGRISLTDPNIARVYLQQAVYQNNLSVQAAKAGQPVVRDDLFELFTPIAPEATHSFIQGIQARLDIRQVIAVPFFIETSGRDGKLEKEYVGNLFAATQSQKFSQWEIDLLQTFGQQAAAGLRNARLYRQAENRRIAAQIFGKMAFSATASLHALRNHIGFISMSTQMLSDEKYARKILSEDTLREQFTDPLIERVKATSELLESLREPFKATHEMPVDVNECLQHAHEKVLIRIPNGCQQVHFSLEEDLPEITTMSEMLTEAFYVIIKNAVEAMAGIDEDKRKLHIQSSLRGREQIEVVVHDNGNGIKPEHLETIFELGTTTKGTGMGFGLFWTRDYIEGLGGSVVIESTWGSGTTVRICIPTTPNEQPPG